VAELPELLEVAPRARSAGADVFGLSYDMMVAGADYEGLPDIMARFLAKKQFDFDVLLYDEDDFEAINERFGLAGEIPVTLAVDKEGRVVDRQEGRANRERFEELLDRALLGQ
jgi:hypothetical protein